MAEGPVNHQKKRVLLIGNAGLDRVDPLLFFWFRLVSSREKDLRKGGSKW
jgi:hypothetical protein